MAHFVIDSVSAKDFAKAIDARFKEHREAHLEAKGSKRELELHEAAVDAAKALVKSGAVGNGNVYAVISTGSEEHSFPRGSGTIVDVRVESRAVPEAPPDEATRASAAAAVLEESGKRDKLESGVAQSVSAYEPGSLPEQQASLRDASAGEQHTIVPPATGYGSAYQPGNTPEELAARRNPGTLPQGTPDATAKLAKKEQRAAKRAAPKRRAASKRASKRAAAASASSTATATVPPSATVTPARRARRAAPAAPKSNA